MNIKYTVTKLVHDPTCPCFYHPASAGLYDGMIIETLTSVVPKAGIKGRVM